jgi:hypothetical protein
VDEQAVATYSLPRIRYVAQESHLAGDAQITGLLFQRPPVWSISDDVQRVLVPLSPGSGNHIQQERLILPGFQ